MIYSGPAFLNENLPAAHGLGGIPLWLAEYTTASQPSLPRGWNSYAIWQYSGNANVNGIGSCDADKAVAGFIV